MISSAPARLAAAMPMPNAMVLIRTGSIAMSCSADWSCDTAIMARPVNVRERNICRQPISTSESTHGTSMRNGRSTNPNRRVLSI